MSWNMKVMVIVNSEEHGKDVMCTGIERKNQNHADHGTDRIGEDT